MPADFGDQGLSRHLRQPKVGQHQVDGPLRVFEGFQGVAGPVPRRDLHSLGLQKRAKDVSVVRDIVDEDAGESYTTGFEPRGE